jgi:hypothetical protein
MSDPKRALVLHLFGGGEPVVFALSEEGAADLAVRLEQLVREGKVHAPALADGATAAVNFAQVVTAHLDDLPSNARVYGSGKARVHGFAT